MSLKVFIANSLVKEFATKGYNKTTYSDFLKHLKEQCVSAV